MLSLCVVPILHDWFEEGTIEAHLETVVVSSAEFARLRHLDADLRFEKSAVALMYSLWSVTGIAQQNAWFVSVNKSSFAVRIDLLRVSEGLDAALLLQMMPVQYSGTERHKVHLDIEYGIGIGIGSVVHSTLLIFTATLRRLPLGTMSSISQTS